MKANLSHIVILLFLFSCSIVFGAIQAVPLYGDIQGVLRNSTDNSLISGSTAFNFTVYNLSNDIVRFSELQTLALGVDGVFNFIYGNNTVLDNSIFKDQVYMKLKVSTEETGAINFTTVPYAAVAQYANDTDYLGGTIASSYSTGVHSNLTGADVVAMVGNYTAGLLTLPNLSLTNVVDNIGNFSAENDSLVHVGSSNQTLVYCGNITGNASNLCTLTDTTIADTNASTACTGDEALLGNSSCLNTSLIDTDTTYADLSEFNDDLGHVEDNASWNEAGAYLLFLNKTSEALYTTTFNATYDANIDTNYSGCGAGEYGDGSNQCINFNTTVNTSIDTRVIAGFVTGLGFNITTDLETYFDTVYEALLVNEAGLYAALSDVTEFVENGDANKTLVYCANITGNASNLCTLTDTDTTYTNASFDLSTIANTGAVDIGAFSFTAETLISDVATGTSPLTISSVTQVANLNASYAGVCYDLTCTDCIGPTEITELADADVSDTLTASDLVAGSEVVADTEVVDDLTIASTKPMNTTGDFTVNSMFNVTASTGNVAVGGVTTLNSNLTITDGTTTYVWGIEGTSLVLRLQ